MNFWNPKKKQNKKNDCNQERLGEMAEEVFPTD